MSSNKTVILELENGHYNAIDIYWVNAAVFEAALAEHLELELALQHSTKLQTTLDPGESYLQGSIAGDYWIARDTIDHERLLMTRAWKNQEILIRGEQRRLPQPGSVLDVLSAAHQPTEPDRNFALDFDGENDVVIVPHTDTFVLGPHGHGYEWTLEAWVYRYQVNIEDPILEKSDAENGGFSLRIGQNNKVQAGIMDGTTFIFGEGVTELEARRWYHIAAVFSGRTAFKFTDRFKKLWSSPSDHYLKNITFYRPIPPAGYVSLGDFCSPGVEAPLDIFNQEATPDQWQHLLERRMLVALHDDTESFRTT